MIHYPIPPHLQQAYNSLNYPEGRFPVAERLARECLSLPLYPGLAQAEYICDMMQEWFLR